jgi:hypothetical protein
MQNPVPASQFKPEDYFRGKTGSTLVVDSLADGIDLADGDWLWESDLDDNNFGSDVAYSVAKENITFNLRRGTPDNANEGWTWAQIVSSPGGDWSDVTHITITYTSDQPIRIILQDNVGLVLAGRGYYYDLPIATNQTQTIPLTDFRHIVTWSPETTAPLAANEAGIFRGIAISNMAENITATGFISKFEIHGLMVDKPDTPTSITRQRTMPRARVATQVTIANGKLSLSLPAGVNNASVALYDVRGRLLFERNIAVNGSFASVVLPQSIVGNQAVILQVKTNLGCNLTKRVLIK